MSALAGRDPPPLRQLARTLRAALESGQAALRRDFEASGNVLQQLHGRSRLVDELVRALWQQQPETLPDLALVAVGGYGRGELFPASDVDLLILLPGPPSSRTVTLLESLVSQFWDCGLNIGHSIRTLGQCQEESAKNLAVRTSLMEGRLICGNRDLFDRFTLEMHHLLEPRQFFREKLVEQNERHQHYQETPYALEPNCKESPGGLRDLQTILWISQAAGLGHSWSQLARKGLITTGEAHQLKRIETFLCALRIRLHHLAQRGEDRLLFDHQETIAAQFGIAASRTRRASELLMQRYYKAAKSVIQLNTILLQNLEVEIFPETVQAPIPIDAQFQESHGLLDVRDETLFEKHPPAIFDSILVMQRHEHLKGMTARTLRALWRARRLVSTDFRRNPVNRSAFLEIFRQKRGIVHALRRLNDYGILGRYLPVFGRIVCQMQHDLFHAYTVDQHILMVIRNLRRFTIADFAHEDPLCNRLINAFDKRWLLYLAALFHDIAKGRGGDHSRLGKADARRFCLEHGLCAEDTALIVWLVEHHLAMSHVAQKQDLVDVHVIRTFASLVVDERRLTALYLLTVADIRGTGLKVWNGWKGKLLEDLYNATLRMLQGDPLQAGQITISRQEDARRLLRYFGLRPGVEEDFWEMLDTEYFLRHDAEQIAWHTRTLYFQPRPVEPIVKARLPHIGAEGLQVMIYTPDQPHLFARLCGFFSRLGYDIAEAKIHTTRNGYALDSFMLLAPDDKVAYRDMISFIEYDLSRWLSADGEPEKHASGRIARQVRSFPIAPVVQIHPAAAPGQYLLSIVAADRPGLLHSIAVFLDQHGIAVHTARIATLGQRVEDTFVISGAQPGEAATLQRLQDALLEILRI